MQKADERHAPANGDRNDQQGACSWRESGARLGDGGNESP